MAWVDLVEPGLSIGPSPLDSDRFGLRIVRATAGGGVDTDTLVRTIDALDADVVIVRYAAGDQRLASAFAATRFAVIPAGALTYWDKAVGDEDVLADCDLDVAPGTAYDADHAALVVRDVIRDSFHGYGNHYTANPLLDRAAALEGYEDWASRTLIADPANVLVLVRSGDAIGVATLAVADDHLEILLAGLLSGAQGQGWYAALLAGCEARARSLGLPRLVISTQVHNIRVQRAWARFGFRPFAAIETLHLVERGALAARR